MHRRCALSWFEGQQRGRGHSSLLPWNASCIVAIDAAANYRIVATGTTAATAAGLLPASRAWEEVPKYLPSWVVGLIIGAEKSSPLLGMYEHLLVAAPQL